MKLMSIRSKGFALPTILIASIVMLMVMLVAVQAASSVSVGLQSQYYNKLASEAAESGLAQARACIAMNESSWTSLTPNSDCSGNSGVYPNGDKVIDNGTLRTTFTVAAMTAAGTSGYALQATGKTVLLRKSTGEVWRSYTQTRYLSARFVTTSPEIGLLVVAGGGGGGRNGGGGGGGGGVISKTGYPISFGSTAITIGSGGAAATTNSSVASSGGDSSFGTLVAEGGGGGASRDGGGAPLSGGSGGGGSGASASPRQVGASGVVGQGYAGGNGTAPDLGCNAAGGGGGGAGGPGTSAVSGQGGNGGLYFASAISGSTVYYSPGGAGGPTCDPGLGGVSYSLSTRPGSGGDGAFGSGSTTHAGLAGIVIISYPTGTMTGTGGSITTSGSNTIHTFTSNGTFTASPLTSAVVYY